MTTSEAGTATQDAELKAKHRKMWASGAFPRVVETFFTPLGPRLVQAAGIQAGQRVLDVAAGTGNAAVEAAKTGGRRRVRSHARALRGRAIARRGRQGRARVGRG